MQETLPAEELRKPIWPRIREGSSRILGLVAIAHFIALIGVMATLYGYAWQKGLYPFAPAVSQQIVPPWAYDETLIIGTRYLFDPFVYSFLFALSSLIVKPNKRAGILLGMWVVAFPFVVMTVFLCAD